MKDQNKQQRYNRKNREMHMRKMTEVSLQEMSRDSLFSKKNNSVTNIVQSTADHSNE